MENTRINIVTSAPRPPESSVLIIYTGGTLGMVHDKGGALKPFDFSSILDHVPSLRKLDLNLTVISFHKPVDSSNINVNHWEEIARIIFDNYPDFDGFVVLHGTDTMAYSASALSFMLKNLDKPVIFTGAQLPISSLRSDARENLITALEIVSNRKNGKPIVSEVCIYFDYFLLRGNRAKKVQSVHFDAFQSENYPELAESGITIVYNHSALYKQKLNGELELRTDFETNVGILKLFPGISAEFVKSVISVPGLKGLVLETFGSGNAPSEPWFIDLMQEAIHNGISVINVSQCSGGKVLQGRYETSKYLQEMGVISGSDLTLESAITKLMIVLASENEKEKIKEKMTASWCGELTSE